jgi:hypothetical protein
MRRWRKMTWAILIFTALMLLWAAGASSNSSQYGQNDYATGVAALSVGLLFFIWLLGFMILAVIWFMTRPHPNVTVYGPAGQQVMVSEKEARRRVEKQGWSYQPRT